MRKNPRSHFSKFEFTEEDYKNCLSIQHFNKSSFKEHFLGQRKKILVGDKGEMIATAFVGNSLDLGKLSKVKFVSLLGRFNKQLYKRFRTIPELYDIDVPFEDVSKGRNDDIWDTMKPGRYFYNIDMRKAYWQITNKLGYLDYNFYMQYIDDDVYKQGLRYCVSFLSRENYMVYHTPKGKITIECDMSILEKVYENIRNQLYNEIFKIRESCKSVVNWNIDAITVLSDEVDFVSKGFKDAGLIYKITECRKIDEYTYSYGNKGEIKNYKQKLDGEERSVEDVQF